MLPVMLLCVTGLRSYAQREDTDSLVVLISSKSAQVVDVDGNSYRKVIGPARFFHNNTYLLCDTAFWSVDEKFIDAIGNVQILQDETVLTGDKLTYFIDRDLAEFRGSLVQLQDKDNNTLRTRNLDYNTKDSVAVFREGGAMRDKDGQIIESIDGRYDSKLKLFQFRNDVNMFSDTVFVKTTSLDYDSETAFATFGSRTDMWNKENMLSSDAGWYNREKEIFLFNKDVHLMSDSQEAWCDSVFYYRVSNDVTMLGNVQIIDTTRNVSAVAGKADYCDKLSRIRMRRDPAVIATTGGEDGAVDTVYVAADFLDYWTEMRFSIDSATVAAAEERLKNLSMDAVTTYRRKAAEEAAKAADQAARENDANYAAKKQAEEIRNRKNQKGKGADANLQGAAEGSAVSGTAGLAEGDSSASLPDSLATPSDSLASPADSSVLSDGRDSLTVAADSLVAATDSLAADTAGSMSAATDSLSAAVDSLFSATDSLAAVPAVPDSTKVGFLTALKNVRLFRNDAQIVCDSLSYSDLDSLARLYVEPIVWQEKTRQYAADSIYVVIHNNAMDRASLMSNAFITIQEDREHFDQIKSAEMMAYFDGQGGLSRFDALGGAQALFFIKEEDELATVNKAESKMLTANFKDGEIQRIYYFDAAKNDGYPIVQLKEEERLLKGFNWKPERRPVDRHSVTEATYRSPERGVFRSRPRARFIQTDRYFPGYMKKIYTEISFRDSLAKARAERQRLLKEEQERLAALAKADSLSHFADSLGRDSLKSDVPGLDSLAVRDSLNVPADSLSGERLAADSLSVADSLKSAPNDKKAEKARLRAERKKAREEREQAKWEEKERKRKEKEAAKAQRKLEKERRRKRAAIQEELDDLARERRLFEDYRRKYLSRRK